MDDGGALFFSPPTHVTNQKENSILGLSQNFLLFSIGYIIWNSVVVSFLASYSSEVRVMDISRIKFGFFNQFNFLW